MRDQRVVLAVVGLWLLSCGAPRICTPGKSEACVGPGGCSGGQSCNADGTGFAVCDCGSTAIDAGEADAGTTDAGLTSCDPTPADGGAPSCPAGQRCTWLRLSPDTGRSVCLANGTVAPNGACTRGPDGETPDAPVPRCTALTTGDVVPPIQNPPGNDALTFYCLPQPTAPKSPYQRTTLEPVTLPRLTGWR